MWTVDSIREYIKNNKVERIINRRDKWFIEEASKDDQIMLLRSEGGIAIK